MSLRARARVAVVALWLVGASAFAQQPPPRGQEVRSMAFEPGLGDAAREQVPGGRLLVGAYSVFLLLIGGWVAFIARKAARLEDEVRRLEDDLARRSPTKDEDAP